MSSCVQCQFSLEGGYGFCPQCGFPVGPAREKRADPLIGRTLAGSYSILELVGVGGMGRVYRAEQRTLGRTVAVKVIQPQYTQDDMMSQRFINEARTISRLNHPNVVGVIDFGRTEDDHLYLVMEFLRGRDLRRVVEEDGALSFARMGDVMLQVLSALGEAHALGIVHRDLKPENIVLEPRRGGTDMVKVVDFGVAKIVQGAVGAPLTNPGAVCGTPGYMAPEQAAGTSADGRADVYAVGVILFELLTGQLPFSARSPAEMMLMQLSQTAPDVRQVASGRGVPEALAAVVARALSREATKRYPTAEEMAQALEAALKGAKPLPPKTPSQPTGPVVQICSSCGSSMEGGQKFCGECGARRSGEFLATVPAMASVKPVGEPPPSIVPPASEPPSSGVMSLSLDRSDDVKWLLGQRSQTRDSLRVARVVGEPGAGKSRLLRELSAAAKQGGDLVIEVGPDPWGALGGASLHVVRACLRQLSVPSSLPPGGPVSERGSQAGAPLYVRRALADLLGKGDPALSPSERRRDVADTLRWAILRASQGSAGPRRVTIVVDDLHRIDGSSRNAVADLLAEPPAAPVLVVCSHAPSFQPDWATWSDVRELYGLGPAAASAALRARVPTGGGPTGLTRPPPPPSGYLPLHLEELARVGPSGRGTPPPRLADLVALRIGRLSAAARHVMQALAVVGDEAKGDQLTLLLGSSVNVRAGLDELAESGMVLVDGARARWAHPLYRDVAQSSIPASARRDLHRRAYEAADALEAPLEARAVFALESGRGFEALFLLEQVAERCLSLDDSRGAIEALTRGLDVARRQMALGELDDPQQIVVLFGRKLGEALLEAGRLVEAEGVLREALDATSAESPELVRVVKALQRVLDQRGAGDPSLTGLISGLEDPRTSVRRAILPALEKLRRGAAS